jgi:hypothetical protein
MIDKKLLTSSPIILSISQIEHDPVLFMLYRQTSQEN